MNRAHFIAMIQTANQGCYTNTPHTPDLQKTTGFTCPDADPASPARIEGAWTDTENCGVP